MKYTLNALFVEINNEFQFHKYFWEGMDAFHYGESSSVLIDERITNYKLEEHRVDGFDFRNEEAYYKLADKYEVINSI